MPTEIVCRGSCLTCKSFDKEKYLCTKAIPNPDEYCCKGYSSKLDPTVDGMYVLLDMSNKKQIKAWNNILWVNLDIDIGFKVRGVWHSHIVKKPLTDDDVIEGIRVPADCITKDGMPTGRALVGLWCRDKYPNETNEFWLCKPDAYDENNGKYNIIRSNGYTTFHIANRVQYIDQDLAKQLMGED